MNISSNNGKKFMTYNYYITCPMPAVELKMNMILSKNPHLIKSLRRYHSHPLIQKYSCIR